MEFRDILKVEIWSKRTSRRIVAASTVVIVGVVSWVFVDGYWFTRAEREAAKSALVKIDSLQVQISEDDQGDFDFRKDQAQQSTEAAVQAALTAKDKRISAALSGYLFQVLMDRVAIKMDRDWKQRPADQRKPGQVIDPKFLSSEAEVRRTTSADLHSALDK